jgi:hypothetical protein
VAGSLPPAVRVQHHDRAGDGWLGSAVQPPSLAEMVRAVESMAMKTTRSCPDVCVGTGTSMKAALVAPVSAVATALIEG